MSKILKKLLADKEKYGDDFSFTLPDGTPVKLGELRADMVERDGEFTAAVDARMTAAETKAAEADRAEQNVLGLWQNYLKVTGLTADEALAGKAPKTISAVAKETDLDESDPIVGALVKTINSLKEEMKGIQTKFSTTEQNVLKPMLGTYLEDFYSDQFEDRILPSLPEKAKEKVTYEAVLAHAQKEGYKDAKGRLNLKRAAKDLAEPFEKEVLRSTMRKEVEKEVRDEMAMASMDRPGSRAASSPRNGTPKSFKNEKGQTKSIDEALQMAMNDDDILASIGNTAAGVA